MSNENDYPELKQRVGAAGRLSSKPAAYYLRHTTGLALVLAISPAFVNR